MIELGALLGAVAAAHAFLNSPHSSGDENELFVTFFVAPLFGAVWGAGAAAAIHFIASGAVLGFALGLFHHGH